MSDDDGINSERLEKLAYGGENLKFYGSSGLDGKTCENTDKHLWRKYDDYYEPSIHVTKSGGIGINVGGHVIVMPVEKWHALGRQWCDTEDVIAASTP